MQLTFYLFDKSVKHYDSAIVSARMLGSDGFPQIALSSSVSFEAAAYFQRNKATRPKWLDFISTHCDLRSIIEVR